MRKVFGLLVVAVLSTALAIPALGNGQDTCPEGDGWVKVDDLDGLSYTFAYTIPDGKDIVSVENCFKAANTLVFGEGLTVTNTTVVNKNGRLQEISHASFRVTVRDIPEDTTTTTVPEDTTTTTVVESTTTTVPEATTTTIVESTTTTVPRATTTTVAGVCCQEPSTTTTILPPVIVDEPPIWSTVPPTTTVQALPDILPFTGLGTIVLAIAALVALIVGSVLAALSRAARE